MGSPFATLQEGLQAAMPGDTVHVLPGTYAASSSVRNGSDNARIFVVSTQPRQAVIQADGTAFEIKHSHHTFEGLVFDCSYGGGDCIEGGGSDALELLDVEVMHSGADCVDLRTSSGVLIESSEIHHCIATYDPDSNADAHGITGDSVFDLTVRDCEIFVVSGDAIQLSPSRDPWGNLLVEQTRMWTGPLERDVNGWSAGTIVGENAFDSKVGADLDGNGANPVVVMRQVEAFGWRGPISNAAAFNVKEDVDFVADRVGVWDSEIAFRLRAPALVRVQNAVVHHLDVGFRLEDGLANLAVYNATLGAEVAQAFTQAGGDAMQPDLRNLLFTAPSVPELAQAAASNLAVDETAFVDVSNDDYHPLFDAAPVDAGEVIAEVTEDFDGVARPVGAAYDIGAYEWTDEPPPGDTDGSSTSDSGDDTASTGAASGSGTATGGSDPTGSATTGTSPGSSSGPAGSGTDDSAELGSDDGCGCRTTSSSSPWWSSILLAVFAVHRRRRQFPPGG